MPGELEQAVLGQQMDKYIIALDQSTQKTGWAIYNNAQLVEYGCFDPSGDLLTRIIKLRDWVKNKINELGSVECLLLEEIQLQNIPGTNKEGNVATFKKLAYVQAILIELAIDLNISYEVIPSSTWKSNCGIHGRSRLEQKQDAQRYVDYHFHIKPIQDTCDAICIGRSYYIDKQESGDTEGFNWE